MYLYIALLVVISVCDMNCLHFIAFQMQEFTSKVQAVLPAIPKNPNPGKSDFKTVEELIDFIVQDGKGKGS